MPENKRDDGEDDERYRIDHQSPLEQIMDCAGEKGNAEQEKRTLHHGSFPKVSGATSALRSSGKCGFG